MEVILKCCQRHRKVFLILHKRTSYDLSFLTIRSIPILNHHYFSQFRSKLFKTSPRKKINTNKNLKLIPKEAI